MFFLSLSFHFISFIILIHFFLDSEFFTLSVRSLNKKNRYKELTLLGVKVVLSKTNIPKLDNTNYASWSSCMRTYLRSRDLYRVVTGEVAPADKKQHKTTNILISHLGNITFYSVITAKNKEKQSQSQYLLNFL